MLIPEQRENWKRIVSQAKMRTEAECAIHTLLLTLTPLKTLLAVAAHLEELEAAAEEAGWLDTVGIIPDEESQRIAAQVSEAGAKVRRKIR